MPPTRLPAQSAICIIPGDFKEKQAGETCGRNYFCLRGLGIGAAPKAATAAERGGWNGGKPGAERKPLTGNFFFLNFYLMNIASP